MVRFAAAQADVTFFIGSRNVVADRLATVSQLFLDEIETISSAI